MFQSIAIFCCLIALVIGVPIKESSDDTKIVGGQDAQDGQFPFMINLIAANGDRCGAALLNEYWGVTAAIWVYGWAPEGIKLSVGNNSRTEGNWVRANDIQLFKDIALVKFPAAVEFNELVQPIPLETEFFDGVEDAVLSGWGDLQLQGSWPETLQYIYTKTITLSECNNALAPYIVNNDEICTYARFGKGACNSDTGSPLVANGKLIGLVYWGIPCAGGWPDVYIRISSYVDVITSIINVPF